MSLKALPSTWSSIRQLNTKFFSSSLPKPSVMTTKNYSVAPKPRHGQDEKRQGMARPEKRGGLLLCSHGGSTRTQKVMGAEGVCQQACLIPYWREKARM